MPEPIANIRCLTEACRRQNVKYSVLDKNGNFVSINLAGKDLYFANYSTPFNSESVAKICRDKEFTGRVLSGVVSIPDFRAYLDPCVEQKNKGYLEHNSIEDISADIQSKFKLPVVVKMNSGARGVNVFKCASVSEIGVALRTIFNRNSKDYDYVALAQEYIRPRSEFRTVVFNGGVELLYETFPRFETGQSAGSLPNTEKVFEFVAPAVQKLGLEFGALDIIESETGKWYLLEINTMPGFDRFTELEGDEKVVKMWGKILRHL